MILVSNLYWPLRTYQEIQMQGEKAHYESFSQNLKLKDWDQVVIRFVACNFHMVRTSTLTLCEVALQDHFLCTPRTYEYHQS